MSQPVARRLPRRPDSPTGGPNNRIVIFSASVGAGHDGAAQELARRLAAYGFRTEIHDFLGVLPRPLGGLLVATYQQMLNHAPWTYQLLYTALDHRQLPGISVQAPMQTACRQMAGLIPPDACLVVSTYPLASQALGMLRQAGRLSVPAATYFTDVSVHRLWISAQVDAHLAMHAVTAAQARRLGAANVVVTGPLVRPGIAPASPAQRLVARRRFGLPADGRLALLASGSWGVGEVARAAAEIARTQVTPVVACGANEGLRRRLAEQGIGHVLGWVTDMPDLMRAVDVVVHNGCGLTVLEAFAAGLPVAGYRCIPGHGAANAAAWDQAGLATWIRRPEQLAGVLTELLGGPRGYRQLRTARRLFTDDPARYAAELAGWRPEEAIDLVSEPRRPRPARTARRPPAEKPAPAVTASAALEPATASEPRIGHGRRRGIRLAWIAASLVALLWGGGLVGPRFAVAHGFGTVRPAGTRQVYPVVYISAAANLTPRVLAAVRADHAAVAIDRRFVRQHPDVVRGLDLAGLTLVNAGDGPPYTTGVLSRRSGMLSTARALRRVTGHPVAFYLTRPNVDLINVGMARLHRETLVIPTTQTRSADLTPSQEAPPLSAGDVVLIECDVDRCALESALATLTQQAALQRLQLASLRQPGDHR